MISLKEKTVTGVVWASVHRFGSMAITFAANMILARLLSPSEYGCIGMLMIFIGLSNTFIDGGFGSALIQKKEPTQTDYSTIYFWNIFLSICLYWILYFSAPSIAKFYNIELLSSILRVQGLVLIFNALGIIQANRLRKYMMFKKLAIVEIVSALLSFSLTIIAALYGYGVWSLVIQQLSLSFIRSLLLWIVSHWKPTIVFSFKSLKELFSFGGFMLLSHLFSTLSNEIQGLFVGKMFSSTYMGYYSQAYRLEGSAATAVSSVVDQVSYPVMAEVQDDRDKMTIAIKRFIQIPAFICSYILAICIVAADPIISIIYGEKWLPCVPYFQILCVAGLAVCLQGSANISIAAIGKSNVFFKWTIIKRSITIVLCVIGVLLWGMYGMLWTCVLGAWSVYVINAMLVQKHIGYSVVNQIKDILPSMLLSIICALLVYWIGSYISANKFVVASIQFVLYTALYLFISKSFHNTALSYISAAIVKKFSR